MKANGSARLTILAIAALLAACTDTLPSTGPNGTSLPGQTSTAVGSGGPEPNGSGPPTGGEPGPPTSTELIQAAVADGRLDEATGIVYRVFAVFEDPRLPSAYTGVAPQEDAFALMRAPAMLESMPPEMAEQLRPYLVRPTDPTSVFHDLAATGTAFTGLRLASYWQPTPITAVPLTAAVTCDRQDHWGYTDGVRQLRVWGRCGDGASDGALVQVAAAADAMYAAESSYLGGRTPNPDSGGEAQGWDARLDIYVTSNCITRDPGNGATPAPAQHCLNGDQGLTVGSSEFIRRPAVDSSSAFILITQGAVGNSAKLNDILAHELFHAFEYSYNTGGFGPGSDWLYDAAATWAQWRFASAPETPALAFGAFQGRTESLQGDAPGNGYRSFGWPLFMEQKGGDGTVRRAWESVVNKANTDEIMDALNGVLSFDENFRIFAMRGWNREIPIGDPVVPWLPAPPVSRGARIKPGGTKSPATIALEGTEKGAAPRTLPGGSPSLWAHYQHFKVKDDVGQVIVDFSGISPGAKLDVDALVKIRDKTEWERRDLPDGKTTWCMDNPEDDIEEFVIVLSDHGRKLTDVLQGTWAVESPLEPCLSYHIHIVWTDTFDGIADTVVFDGWADGLNPDTVGEGVVALIGTGTYSGSRAGYVKCNPGLEGMPTTGGGTATFQAVIVGDRVTVNAFSDINSTFPGITTWPFEGPREGTYDKRDGSENPIVVNGPSVGELCPHAYSGEATYEIKLKPPP